MRINLEPYQKEALSFLLQNKHSALFIDPGLGKTAIVLSLIKQLKTLCKIKSVLVIAPIRPLYTTWPDEIKLWDQFNSISYSLLHGDERFKNLQEDTDIKIVNPENFQWVLNWCNTKKDFPFDTLIIDESTKFKSTRSKRFKILKKYLDKFNRRHIMTGTPIPNTYLDLFSQMFIVNKNILGEFITHYTAKYFYFEGYKNKQPALRKFMDKRIQKKIKPYAFTLTDTINTTKAITNNIKIKLPDELQEKYNNLEKQFFIALDEDKNIFASSAAHKYGLCKQFCSGQIYDENGTIQTIHDLKLVALQDLIAELQNKSLLIAYYYKHELQRLKNLFGKKAVYAEKPKDFAQIKEQWNKKKINLLVAQCSSLAHGLNLQHGGNNIAWYSLTDSLEDYQQFNRRLQRKGQQKTVVIHRLVVKDSVDMVQVYRINRKGKTQNDLMNALQKYRKGLK